MTIHMIKEIETLKKLILEMGAKVEKNLHDAVAAVESMEVRAAERLIQSDEEVDKMEIDIEEECLKCLALHQPVAGDLRLVISILKINNELERINDVSVNIAERVVDLAGLPRIKVPFDLGTMAEKVQWMLSKSLDSLINTDVAQVKSVIQRDDEIDARHRSVYHVIRDEIQKHPEHIDVLIQFPSLSRYLERVADLACNIAEDVIYMVEGDIVRHEKM